jgi:serine/threonine protein phosphatase PrpC
MTTIVCAKCGFENPDLNKFCQNCGFKFASASANVVTNAGATTTVQLPKAPSESPETSAWEDVSAHDIATMSVDIPSMTATDASEAATETSNEVSQDEAENDIAVDDVGSNLGNLTPELESTISVSNPAISPTTTDRDTGSVNTDEVNGDISDRDNLSNPDLRAVNPSEQLTAQLEAEPVAEPEHPIASTEQEIALTKNQKPGTFSISYAGLTDVGKQRDHNEDNFTIATQIATTELSDCDAKVTVRGVFVVCDGMGGHAGGEVASSLAIEKITEMFRPFWINKLPGAKTLREIIHVANQAIYDRNEIELRRDSGRMGTTLVLMANYENEVAIAHVGDSRIYQVTATELKQITRDHEVANRLIDRGVDLEEAMSRHDAHQLTQALGPYDNSQVDPSILFLQVNEPTLFLLCSDGLCDNDLVEQNWETYLLPLLTSDADLKSGVKNLIDLGNTINGHDNITAILVRCQFEQPQSGISGN